MSMDFVSFSTLRTPFQTLMKRQRIFQRSGKILSLQLKTKLRNSTRRRRIRAPKSAPPLFTDSGDQSLVQETLWTILRDFQFPVVDTVGELGDEIEGLLI